MYAHALTFILSITAWFYAADKPGIIQNPEQEKTTQGDTFNAASFKGKILVLNFWASWSKASRSENKNLVRVYQLYRLNQNVAFASVSLDLDETAWKLAIQEDAMDWTNHYCDFKKYDSPAVKAFDVHTLPRFMVLDKSGKIVHSATGSQQLEQVIQEQLRR